MAPPELHFESFVSLWGEPEAHEPFIAKISKKYET